MDDEETLALRLAAVDDQLAEAIAHRDLINERVSTLTKQRRYIRWMLDVLHIRQSIRQLTAERDGLEEHLAEVLASGDTNSSLDESLKDVRERLVAAEDSLASLLANPPGNNDRNDEA